MNHAESICLLCMREKAFPEQVPCPHCGGDDRTLTVQSPALPPRTVLDGRYVLGRTLGQGGFGITYQAYDLRMNNTVAVKEYFPSSIVGRDSTVTNLVTVNAVKGGRAQNEYASGLRHFLNEAHRQAKMVSSPGVVSVTDFFEANNTAYYVMEYVDGCDLVKYIRESQPLSAVIALLEPIAESLMQIHAAGMIHRDISPDNIMCAKNGSRKLLDFGASHNFTEDESTTGNATLKHGFAPPEQYGSSSMQGPWTDVYAFAATIYWCITGKVPQDSMDRSIGGDQLRRPSELGAVLTPEAEQVLLRGMTLAVTARYQEIRTFWNALKKANAKPMPQEQPGNPTEQPEQTQVSRIVTRTQRPSYYYEEPEVTINASLPVRPQSSGRRMERVTSVRIDPPVQKPSHSEEQTKPTEEPAVPEEPDVTIFRPAGGQERDTRPERQLSLSVEPEHGEKTPTTEPETPNIVPTNGKKRKRNTRYLAASAAVLVAVMLGVWLLPKMSQQGDPDASTSISNLEGNVTIGGQEVAADATELYLTGNSQYTTQRFSNLNFYHVENLDQRDMETIGQMRNLNKLYLVELGVEDLTSLAGLKGLQELCLYGNKITNVAPLSKLTKLYWLDLGGNQLEDVSSLSGLTALVRLYLQNNQLTNLTGLEKLTSLQTLNVCENRLEDASALEPLQSLSMLSVDGCGLTQKQIVQLAEALPHCAIDVDVLTEIPENVRIGEISYSTGSNSLYLVNMDLSDSDLANLKYMVNLTTLDLSGNNVSNLEILKDMTGLKSLSVEQTNVEDISVLERLFRLEKLSLANAPVDDLTPLSQLTELVELDLHETSVKDLSPLAGLDNLTELNISQSEVTDLSPLKDCDDLKLLIMEDCNVTDLTPLYEVHSLREVQLSRYVYDDDTLAALQEQLPGCLITQLN